jgi:hypothetical protein
LNIGGTSHKYYKYYNTLIIKITQLKQIKSKRDDRMDNFLELFTEDTIEHYRTNKQEITEEILHELRLCGNEGKQIALEILDLDKDGEQYYLDAFGNRMSFNGNRRLKKAFTKIPLAEIHKIEIGKCAEDIHYFKDNYVKIKTKRGINFPDLRPYQDDFIEVIAAPDNDSILGLMPRQSGKTITVAIYLSHCSIFMRDINVGIVANKGKSAREFLASTKNILVDLPSWMQLGIQSWNKSFIEIENGMRILTDVPSEDSFRGFTIALLVCDETAFINPSRWDIFADSIFPSQSGLAWTKNLIISTANGMNHFYDMVKAARDGTNDMVMFEVNWRDVPRFNSDGTQMLPEDFRDKVIKKHGIVHFNQNYGNEFMGSSHTLIKAEILSEMKEAEIEEIRDGKLNIYHYPIKGHNYIMTVDASKDGKDAFAVQVIDITDFKFIQCATAQLQIDYLLMPEFLDEWCELYNTPYLVIENNEGAGQSIADQMFNDYEYNNLHYDKKVDSNSTNNVKSKKKYPGFRTTTKSRKQILQTLKLFIENDNLEINDKSTITEFYRFILIKNKYQADEGAHDDMIMSLALTFVPFVNSKNFQDMKGIVQNLYSDDNTGSSANFADYLTIGEFQDGSDESEHFSEPNTNNVYLEENYLEEMDGFY